MIYRGFIIEEQKSKFYMPELIMYVVTVLDRAAFTPDGCKRMIDRELDTG